MWLDVFVTYVLGSYPRNGEPLSCYNNNTRKLTRRSFLCTTATAAATASGGEHRPNVLVIMCDQLNPRVLSAYGGPVETPNIERIARRGVVFHGATCTTPFCSPSRASLVTGLYPHTHGIRYNVNRKDYPAIGGPATEEGIRKEDLTTERILFESGYSTHQFGKWHLAGDALPCYTDQYGEHHEYAREMAAIFVKVRKMPREQWMNWYGWALPVTPDQAYRKSFELDPLPERRHLEFIEKAGKLELPPEKTFEARIADKAIEWLRDAAVRPFMITCSFNLPHDPNVIPSPYYEMYRPEKIKLPANFATREARFEQDWSRQIVGTKTETRIRELLRIYYGSVRLVDDQVGRVLDALEATGRAADTIIVFTADHGDMAGAHGMFWKSTSAFYDDVATIPFIVSYPRRFGPGRSDACASLVDICPTLLELTGHPVPAGVEGRSLVPALTGKGSSQDRAYNFCERVRANKGRTRTVAPGTPGSFMVRGQGWKYIRYADRSEYLYDLRRDPGETRNLAEARLHQPRKRELIQQLEGWLHATGFPL